MPPKPIRVSSMKSSTANKANIRDILFAYAAEGWHLFSVKKDKTPYTAHGFKDATQTQLGIDEYLKKYPDVNWAARLSTGGNGQKTRRAVWQ